MLLSLLISSALLSLGLTDESDTFSSDSLQAVTITADKGVIVSRTDTISINSTHTLTDVLQLCTGVFLSDNGGYSGLKTVSLRGMGSAHTSIYVDGVKVGNVQSGQNDLNSLGTDNFSSAVIDYAQNSLSFNTARPEFGKSRFTGHARMYGGSFGTYLPSLRLSYKISDRLSLTGNAAGVISKGNYRYGDGLVRENNDMKQVKGGIDLFGRMNYGDYHIKAYFNASDRGTPGSVSWPSTDRQKDKNAFIQGRVKKSFSPIYSLRISTKCAYDQIRYLSSWGNSTYGQSEFQLNSAHDFQIFNWWKVSFAADLGWDGLKSNIYEASRTSIFSAMASAFRFEKVSADLALEYNGAFDADGENRTAFSPSADVRITITDELDVVAYGRRAYRIPTFNELYYTGFGNPSLKPEDAIMTDIGVDYNNNIGKNWKLKAKFDGFYNHLKNKIISSPSEEDPNIWRPYNIGIVRAIGVDLLARAEYNSNNWLFAAETKYTFQSAKDRTPQSDSYNQMIPFVSKHSAAINGWVTWKGWSLVPTWQLRAGRTDGYGELDNWNTIDIMLSKRLNLKNIGDILIKVSGKNIGDNRYEIAGGYPMPGRSFICGVEFNLR